jgi:Mce-associated membrane protein
VSQFSSKVAALRRSRVNKPDRLGSNAFQKAPIVGVSCDDDDATTETAEDSALRVSQKEGHRSRVVAFAVLPVLVLMVAAGAAWLKFYVGTAQDSSRAAADSVRAASDSAVAILSYKAGTVEQDLTAATDRLTGDFKGQYVSLTHDVVIPGAKQQQISSTASVPAAASISATASHAEVLVFANQTVTIGHSTPTDTASTVRVTMERVGGRWLVSGFDPV